MRFICLISLIFYCNSFAASLVHFHQESPRVISQYLTVGLAVQSGATRIDANQVTHQRFQQTYQGVPVYGGNFIVHNNTNVTGKIFINLAEDLTRYSICTSRLSNGLLQTFIRQYHQQHPRVVITDTISQPYIFIDSTHTAHWVYKIAFFAKSNTALPAHPVWIVDANTGHIYRHWDALPTYEAVMAGGLGGNVKTGQIYYDNQHQPALTMQRNPLTAECYLQNAIASVLDASKGERVVHFPCAKRLPQHNNIFWNNDLDAINGAYSPANDALYAAGVVSNLFLQWYHIPVLSNPKLQPLPLTMLVHANMENAYWHEHQIVFGDGGQFFYPLTSLTIAAHEISHGFTEQQANLEYEGQSGGINEAFSDMAAVAAQYFTHQPISWQLGLDVSKDNAPLRYLDDPTKDCVDRGYPGDDCSIANASDYYSGLNVHYSSGVYNKLFYVLSTTPGWSPRKAFDVMVTANRFYWLPTDDFEEAACGLKSAARDNHYDVQAVTKAIRAVGINLRWCQ